MKLLCALLLLFGCNGQHYYSTELIGKSELRLLYFPAGANAAPARPRLNGRPLELGEREVALAPASTITFYLPAGTYDLRWGLGDDPQSIYINGVLDYSLVWYGPPERPLQQLWTFARPPEGNKTHLRLMNLNPNLQPLDCQLSDSMQWLAHNLGYGDNVQLDIDLSTPMNIGPTDMGYPGTRDLIFSTGNPILFPVDIPSGLRGRELNLYSFFGATSFYVQIDQHFLAQGW
jgi:hypothetical protein